MLYSLELSLINLITAQVSFGGSPISFSNLLTSNIPIVIMPPVDVEALLQIDEIEEAQGLPFRFGFGSEVNYNLDNSGVWDTLSGGERIWRLCIFSPGAFSINLIYDQFWLPNGATFFLYNHDTTMVLGAFTSQNNKPHGKFSTEIVKGNRIFLEYYEPEFVEMSGTINISRVIHGYKNLYSGSGGFGESQWCEINVHCSEGVPWSDEIRSVGMIVLSDGTRLGSGALINNVEVDLTPYFLTAQHLIPREPETWLFYFNYESCNCGDPSVEPSQHVISGSTLRAMNWSSDFLLVELSQNPPIPDYYNLYYSGWSNVDIGPNSSVGIHHPAGDIKKISFVNNQATSYTIDYPEDNYWKVIYYTEDNGTVEGGSSGSPLFNPDQRIVGQLRTGQGGGIFCSVTHDAFYGKFSLSWDYGSDASSRLKDWLDPNNTGATTLDGISDYSAPEPPVVVLKSYTHRQGFELVTHPRLVWGAVQGHCLTYEIYRALSTGNWQLVASTTGISWIDHGINMDGGPDPVYYKVKAINNIPLESQYSNVVTANTTFHQKIQSNIDAVTLSL